MYSSMLDVWLISSISSLALPVPAGWALPSRVDLQQAGGTWAAPTCPMPLGSHTWPSLTCELPTCMHVCIWKRSTWMWTQRQFLHLAGPNSHAKVQGKNQPPPVWRGPCIGSSLAILLPNLNFSVHKCFFSLRYRSAADQIRRMEQSLNWGEGTDVRMKPLCKNWLKKTHNGIFQHGTEHGLVARTLLTVRAQGNDTKLQWRKYRTGKEQNKEWGETQLPLVTAAYSATQTSERRDPQQIAGLWHLNKVKHICIAGYS